MALQPALEKKLGNLYPPDSRIDDTFRGKDITIITNQTGEAVTLFIGKRSDHDGSIKGERYVRRIHRNGDQTIRKSHWECKGKSN
jgi:hypothetical protein